MVDGGFSPDLVRAELTHVLASPGFVNSVRLQRFLRFAVEKWLEGRASELKESVLAVEVFDRRADYDPRLDSVVRVEARRLRARLRQYYGATDRRVPLVIEIPEGSYVPRCDPRPVPEPGRALAQVGVAVLPFVNLSPDADQEFFCDGVTDEVITALSRVPGLNVVARTSAFQFKGRSGDVREIGERLRASVIVEGSVRRAGDRVRVTAQVVNAVTGYQVATKTFDGGLDDVFAIQDRIAAVVTRAVAAGLGVDAPGEPSPSLTHEVEAHTACLRARYHWNKQTIAEFRVAAALFEDITKRFPEHAPAWAGLADCHSMLTTYGAVRPSDAAPVIHAAAGRALELDPGLAQAHVALAGVLSFYDFKWSDAAGHFVRAIGRQPGFALARYWYGVHHAALGRLDAAEAEVRAALSLDPLSLDINRALGTMLYFRGDYQSAETQLLATLDLDPGYPDAWQALGALRLRQGRPAEAIDALERGAGHTSQALHLGGLGEAYARGGRISDARAILRRLKALARHEYVSPMAYAAVFAGLDEWDSVLDALGRAVDERTALVCWAMVDPRYAPLSRDARFLALLGRIGVRGQSVDADAVRRN